MMKIHESQSKGLNDMIKTNILGDKIPKESVHHTCIACITIDSIMKMEKKSTSLFRRVQIQIKENKDDQIHKNWITVRVRVKVRIWHWIRVKARIWFWIVSLLLFIADGCFLNGLLAKLSHFTDFGLVKKINHYFTDFEQIEKLVTVLGRLSFLLDGCFLDVRFLDYCFWPVVLAKFL